MGIEFGHLTRRIILYSSSFADHRQYFVVLARTEQGTSCGRGRHPAIRCASKRLIWLLLYKSYVSVNFVLTSLVWLSSRARARTHTHTWTRGGDVLYRVCRVRLRWNYGFAPQKEPYKYLSIMQTGWEHKIFVKIWQFGWFSMLHNKHRQGLRTLGLFQWLTDVSCPCHPGP